MEDARSTRKEWIRANTQPHYAFENAQIYCIQRILVFRCGCCVRLSVLCTRGFVYATMSSVCRFLCSSKTRRKYERKKYTGVEKADYYRLVMQPRILTCAAQHNCACHVGYWSTIHKYFRITKRRIDKIFIGKVFDGCNSRLELVSWSSKSCNRKWKWKTATARPRYSSLSWESVLGKRPRGQVGWILEIIWKK